MTDICMDVDTALSEVPVNVMPLVDDGDFKSIEEAVAYNATGLDLVWNFVTSGGAATQTAVTPTTGGDYDWAHQGNGIYTIEIPASGGASINNDTEGYGWFSGVATGVLPWRGPIITFRAAALNDALIDGGDNLDVNVTQWLGTAAASPATAGVPSVDVVYVSGDSTAADNLEADYDNTGYAKANSTIGTVTNLTNDPAEIISGTCQSGSTSTTIVLASGASATDDLYNRAIVLTTGGTGAAQCNLITDYVGSTKTATVVAAWATTPDNTTTYKLYPLGGTTLTSSDVGDAVWDEALSGHTTAGTAGKAVSDIETDAAAILVDTGTTIPGTISTIDSNVDAILVDTGTTLPATLGTPTDLGGGATLADNNADMAGATFSTSTDSQEAIRNNQSAAADAALLQTTTIATLASQTSFTLTAGSADDDAYNNAIAIVTDQSTSTQKAVGTVLDYTGSSKTVTLSADPGVFTMAVGDTIDIIAALGSAGSAPTAAAIADAVWDEALSGHTTAGTAGKSLADTETDAAAILVDTGTTIPGVLGTPAGADLATDIAAVKSDTAATLVDTGTTIPGVLGTPAGADMAADIAAVKADTAATLTDTAEIGAAGAGLTAVPWNSSWDAEVQSEVTDALNAYDPPTNAELSSAVSGLATAAALATVDSNVDSILDDTGTSGVVVAGTLDVNVAQISGSSTAADNLEESAKGIVSGACEGTPSTTVIQTDLAETTDDHYIGRTIIFTSGDADGEATEITDYTGSTGTVTVTALTTAPSASDTFVIV